MPIGEVRLYRDQGLLPPVRRQRSRSGDSAYTEEHIRALRLIKQARACGYTFEDITKFLDASGLMTCGDVYTITRRRLEQVSQDRTGDNSAIANLEKLLDVCDRVGRRQDCGLCPRVLIGLANMCRARSAGTGPPAPRELPAPGTRYCDGKLFERKSRARAW
jgi:DNA-binding transcriptional MerR regulator